MARISFDQDSQKYVCIFPALVGGTTEDARHVWSADDTTEFALIVACTGLSDLLFRCNLRLEAALNRIEAFSYGLDQVITWWQLLYILTFKTETEQTGFWQKNQHAQTWIILNWLKEHPQTTLVLSLE